MLHNIASRLSPSTKTLLKTRFGSLLKILRVPRRRSFAMSYYQPQLNFIKKWARLNTEESNFYYLLTPDNQDHLAWIISHLTGETHGQIVAYFAELQGDESLRSHITNALRATDYGRDIKVEYGRRLGWYAFVRALKPSVVIETGIDHGVGSCVLASALLRNAAEGAPGRYYGTDIRREAGQLFRDDYAKVGEILYGDSIESLNAFTDKIDLFINDSDHSGEYEYREYQVVKDKLSVKGVILGDNAHATDSLSRFSHEAGRQFLFFSEKPADHWYPGAGIGISFPAAYTVPQHN